MDNKIQLTYDTVREGCLTLHPEMAKRFGIKKSTQKKIRFGSQSFPAKIHSSFKVQLYEASLSVDLLDKIGLPSNCRFEIQQKGNEIQIGPYIGLLAGYYKKSIARKLDDLVDYLSHYPDIKGAILVFCIENIDQINQTVNGYIYNPVTNSWDEGVYPYPSSIFVITEVVGKKWISYFESIIGHTVFNHIHFNKWNIFNLLAESIDVKSYLPQTILYESPQQLFSFLKKHPFVTVKSISTAKSSQSFRISRDEFFLVITDLNKGRSTRINCIHKDQAFEWFSNHLKEREFMIQKSLDSNQISSIDIRLIMVKDENEIWKLMGMFGRKGKLDNHKQPIIRIDKDILSEVLKLSEVISSLLIHEVQSIALDAIHVLESSDIHIANTAINMTVDNKGRIWISDIHHLNPSHEIALVAGYPEIYYETLKTNMLYAKKLAGFL